MDKATAVVGNLKAVEDLLTTLVTDSVLIAVGVVGLIWILEWRLVPLLKLKKRTWQLMQLALQICGGLGLSIPLHWADAGPVKAVLFGLATTVGGLLLWPALKAGLPFLKRFIVGRAKMAAESAEQKKEQK